jgi:K+ transporter
MSIPSDQPKTAGLALAALGVVYGNIGTSPLYALRECFHASHGLSITLLTIVGLLSLIIYRTQGLDVDLDGATFFLSRVNSLATPKPGMALWRERLFIFLSRNSQRASSFFHIPAEQVVEIGVVVEI